MLITPDQRTRAAAPDRATFATLGHTEAVRIDARGSERSKRAEANQRLVGPSMTITEKLRESLERRRCMRLKTRHPDGDRIDGVVVGLTKTIVVLHQVEDFEFDGFVVMPKKLVAGVRDGKYEACGNEILRENGALQTCRPPRWLEPCETLFDVVAAMKRRDMWPFVETIAKSGKRTECRIGPITAIRDEHFNLRGYDAAGGWEEHATLHFADVFKVEFGSRYCEHFNAYMRKRPQSD